MLSQSGQKGTTKPYTNTGELNILILLCEKNQSQIYFLIILCYSTTEPPKVAAWAWLEKVKETMSSTNTLRGVSIALL